jgi:hypothetical protein
VSQPKECGTVRISLRQRRALPGGYAVECEELGMVPGKPKCQLESCAKSALISLESLGLCLEHFLSTCYERLDHLEPMIRRRTLEEAHMRAAYAFLEECSDRALFIALQQERLTNQDRSRLLNILLLTRHLQLLLKNPVGIFTDSLPHASAVLSGSGSRQK